MDPLFRSVGNTDEVSASAGGDSSLYSPFGPDYAYTGLFSSDVVQQNPPTTVSSLTGKSFETQEELRKATLSVRASLGLAGFFVSKDWESARTLCKDVLIFLEKAKEAGKKIKLEQESSTTFYMVYSAFLSYMNQILNGQHPFRVVDGKPYPIENSVWDCCLSLNGNVKLPFAAYSEAPVATCPGAGGVRASFAEIEGSALGAAVPNENKEGCAHWCYSIKALAYPAPAARMLLNTLSMSLNPEKHVSIVTEKMLTHSSKTKILRLFVDGDFRDINALRLWMDACKKLGKAGVSIYGYSKSWDLFLDLHKKRYSWPKNYVLNLSSGSRHNEATREKMKAVPVVRNQFVAVDPFLKLMEKIFQQKEGVLGKVKARRLYDIYKKNEEAIKFTVKAKNATELRKALNDMQGIVKQRIEKVMSKKMGATKIRQFLLNELQELRLGLWRRMAGVNPKVLQAWASYQYKLKVIESKLSSYTKSVKGTSDTRIKPGQVLQALTWQFLTLVIDPKTEFSCPIKCGNCPGTAINNHKSAIPKLIKEDFEGFKQLTKGKAKDVATKAKIHACGNAKEKRDILIGLH